MLFTTGVSKSLSQKEQKNIEALSIQYVVSSVPMQYHNRIKNIISKPAFKKKPTLPLLLQRLTEEETEYILKMINFRVADETRDDHRGQEDAEDEYEYDEEDDDEDDNEDKDDEDEDDEAVDNDKEEEEEEEEDQNKDEEDENEDEEDEYEEE